MNEVQGYLEYKTTHIKKTHRTGPSLLNLRNKKQMNPPSTLFPPGNVVPNGGIGLTRFSGFVGIQKTQTDRILHVH